MGDERLIQLVKQHEVIYNTKCQEYGYTDVRKAAWEEIAKLHGKSVDECKENWHRLRTAYSNALKRRDSLKRKKIPPWRFQEQMSFLKANLGTSRRRNGYFLYNARNDDFVSDESSRPEQESVETRTSSPEFATMSRSSTPSSNASYNRKENSNRYNIDEDGSPQVNRNHMEDMDELDMFFLSMSKSLKKLPRLDQIRIKMDLLKAVCDAELKHLKEQEDASTSRSLKSPFS